MRLTTFSDYTIRTLVYLGLQHGQLVTISNIAEAYAISDNHLMKVVHLLGQRGYVETIRGKGGGLRLGLAPEDINLGKLLRTTEGDGSLLDCMDNASTCCIQPACELIGILREAQNAMFAVLDQYTMADLLQREQPLARILMFRKSATNS